MSLGHIRLNIIRMLDNQSEKSSKGFKPLNVENLLNILFTELP